MTHKNNLTAKLAAVMMIVFMISSSMTTLAFAEPEGGSSQIAQLKQAMLDAEQAMNNAKAEMDQAEAALKPYKSDWDSKIAEADEADAAVTDAVTALSNAEQAVTDAIQQRRDSAQAAYDNAVAAYNDAEQAYNNAAQAAEAKQTELNNAQAAKTALENEISTLTTEKMEAYTLTQSLPSQIALAEQTVTNANDQWELDKQTAAAAVNEAQADMDAAGRNFINAKINAQNGNNLDTMIAACKTYTNASFTSVTDSNGNTYSSVADVANSSNFEKVVDRACTYENLKKSISYIREANVHRNLSIHNAGDLKVSYQLMGTAVISNAISVFQTGHNLTKGDTNWNFWRSGNSMAMSENLAYSGASSEMGWDPFHGWYYKERMRAVANDRGETTVSQDIVDEILQESVTNGYTYNPYTYPWYQTKERFRNGISDVTGHYTNMIDPAYKATGFSYINGEDYALTDYPYVAAQEFNGDTSSSVTVDAYEQELDAWFEEYLTALEEAEGAYQALETKPDYVTAAEGNLQDLQNQLTAAQTTVDEKIAAINGKQAELQNVESSITTLTQELETANANKTAKEQAKSDALAAKNAAEAAKNKADAIDPSNSATYEDDEEIKNLVKAYNDADAALPPLQQEAEGKRADATAAEQTYNAKKGDYDQKKEAYDNAVAAYNSAKAAYENAADISKATITVADQTYSGKELTPTPEVVLNDSTLVMDSDYTVKYANNTNAGTATVTVMAKGDDYIGEASKTFTIKAKAITPDVTLSKAAFTYNAKVQKPKVTVKTGSTTLAAANYNVTFPAGCKNVGVYKVTVKMTGNYSGSKTVSYKINPKGTSLKKLTAAPKALTATWSKQAGKMATARITGYQVQYSLNKNFKTGNKTANVAGYAKTAKKITGLKAKKVYYVRVRTYKKIGSTTLYSGWSKALKVKTK